MGMAGRDGDVHMRILPPHIFLAAILVIVAANLLLDTPRPIPGPYDRVLGILLVMLGLTITGSSAFRFRVVKTNIIPYNDPNELVTSGWFRYTRNPMYLGMVVMLAGVAIGLGELVGYAIPPLFMILIDRTFIPMEERAMQRVFGTRYDDYRQKVRRWI
jgi:protein-S-isoprenylcysteine O-methyltransferase Ste14